MVLKKTSIIITHFQLILSGMIALCLFSTLCWAYCQPQCITTAREITGINSCRVGTNGYPSDWYSCEKKRDKTTSTPAKGRAMVLQSPNHVLAVVKCDSKNNSKYALELKHSNFNNICGTEKCKATYDKSKKKVTFNTGAWKGRTYTVSGFIKK